MSDNNGTANKTPNHPSQPAIRPAVAKFSFAEAAKRAMAQTAAKATSIPGQAPARKIEVPKRPPLTVPPRPAQIVPVKPAQSMVQSNAPKAPSTASGPIGIPPVAPSRPELFPQQVKPASTAGAAPAKFSFNMQKQSVEDLAAEAAKAKSPHVLVGTLIDLKMYNNWGIGKVTSNGTGEKVSVKGEALAGMRIGMRYKFHGVSSQHAKFGAQFEVHQVMPDVESVESLIAHMTREYKGLPYGIAMKVAHFHRDNGTLEQLKQDLIHRPASVRFDMFTNKQVSLRNDDDSNARRVQSSLVIRFGGLGIPDNVFKGLALHLAAEAAKTEPANHDDTVPDYVSIANKIFDENPYGPLTSVERYGFHTADLLASRIGINRDDPNRIAAVVAYALAEGCAAGGHAYLDEPTLFHIINRIDPNLDPREAVDIALDKDAGVEVETNFGQLRYYDAKLYRHEIKLAKQLAHRLTHEAEPLCPLVGEDLEELIDKAVSAVAESKGNPNFKLDKSQREAVAGILTSRCTLHTLTAGPGRGKTAIVEVLMTALQLMNEFPAAKHAHMPQTVFCAPIGKAAKVLTNRVGTWGVARTIHSTLECTGEGFERNADNPLEADLIVADEESMLGTPLGSALFDAAPRHAHILMMGDPNQLAPIEPGQVLKSVLSLEGFDHHRLKQPHRNSGAILEVCDMATDGIWPTSPQHISEILSHGDVDFYGSLPEPNQSAFEQLALEIRDAAERRGGLERVGVMCPMRKGSAKQPGWNVTYLNAFLREALNADPDEVKKIAGSPFRLNDRIIVCRNMTIPIVDGDMRESSTSQKKTRKRKAEPVFSEDGEVLFDVAEEGMSDDDSGEDKRDTYVVNGDTGWLENVTYVFKDGAKQPSKYILRLDDGRKVLFPAEDVDELNLAYAITVHAAQGSEYLETFNFITPGHEQFMHRSMVLTMLSRTQAKMKVYGDQSTLVEICSRRAPERNCGLQDRVLQLAGQIMGEKIDLNFSRRNRNREAA